MTISENRHQRNRMKSKRRNYYSNGIDAGRDPKALGKMVKTPRPCSCWMCVARKNEGDTVQQRRAVLSEVQ